MYTKLVEKVDIRGEMVEVTDVALVKPATEDGSLANSGHEPIVQRTDIRMKPEFATALASAYNGWLFENRLKHSSRKTCYPAYTKGDHSRCSGR